MSLFKRKPIIEEAIQYQEGKAYEVEAFVGQELDRHENSKGSLIIPGESNLLLPNGWLVKKMCGKLRIYGPSEFNDRYEPAKRKRSNDLPDFKHTPTAPETPTIPQNDKPGSQA